ncbi:hypothetical protein GCM10020219_097220 [Nonomuraea dietziae]
MSPRPGPGREFILTVSCSDKPGIVYAVSSFLVQHRGDMLQSKQFNDRRGGGFFMRVHFAAHDGLEELREGFAYVAESFQMTWQLNDAATPTRALVMVSKFGHCVNDLLFRRQVGGPQHRCPRDRLQPSRSGAARVLLRRALPPRPGHR